MIMALPAATAGAIFETHLYKFGPLGGQRAWLSAIGEEKKVAGQVGGCSHDEGNVPWDDLWSL